ncbi:gluconokinase [Planosporangium thailandense]|uniref:Gluconokinase n=1 Tax=Planosporangium thailandense TaxID=765197 RepID=A0ABX0XZ56_9ACTN|nr:gluconokinase [Planosporangium thailandense]NJC70524.1 gluconokinase [Planosporangium thailandense]
MTGDGRAATNRRGATPTRHIVVMGVSGSGKTTVAKEIGRLTALAFAEADEFHSADNVAMMRAGVPLDDADRWPWLRALATWMAARAGEGVSTVLACSALKRSYRDVLRLGAPDTEFVHLDGPVEVIRERLATRAGHYMPASLLDSQVAILEPLQADESGLVLDASLTPAELVSAAVSKLGLPCRRGEPPGQHG